MMVNGKRYEWTFNAPVAVVGGEVVMLDYVFDRIGGDFHGAVGTTYRPVTRDEFDYWTSREGIEERVEDIWRDMVAGGGETRGLAEFVDDVIAYDGAEQTAFPDRLWDDDLTEQFRRFLGVDEDEAYIFEWSSGGRVFDRIDENFDALTGDRILDHGLWNLALLYEDRRDVDEVVSDFFQTV